MSGLLQTKHDIRMGNNTCWILPAGTKGHLIGSFRFRVIESSKPPYMTRNNLGDYLHLDRNVLEPAQ